VPRLQALALYPRLLLGIVASFSVCIRISERKSIDQLCILRIDDKQFRLEDLFRPLTFREKAENSGTLEVVLLGVLEEHHLPL
jgi:hypothetical protein